MLAVAGPASAQSLPGIALPTTAPSPATDVRIEGIYQTAPVRLDGNTLFRVATPTTSGSMPADVRAGLIEDVLGEIVAKQSADPNAVTKFDPESLHVQVQPDAPQALLVATDATHLQPFPIMTVTTVDARYQRLTVDVVAQRWREILQVSLETALLKRQPAEVRKNTGDVVRIGAALLVGTLVVWLVVSLVRRRVDGLTKQIEETSRAMAQARGERALQEPDDEALRRRFVDLAIRVTEPETRVSFLRAFAAILIWGTVLAWFLALIWGLILFPQTASLGQTIARRAARIVFLWIGAAVLLRLLDIVLARFAEAARRHVRARNIGDEERSRQLLRIPTLARALHDVCWGAIIFAATLTMMGALGLPIASVLTIGGLAALGISFAAQNLLRDFLNGSLVLFEDQYVIGDYVIIGEWSGLVEQMTLRTVQLRDTSGNLVTIPYGATSTVINCSRYWSRIDYRVAVAPDADVAKALATMRATLEELSRDANWRNSILDPVEWTGVEGVGASGILLRACVKTAPLRQFELRREINARMVAAFREAQIPLGQDPTAPGAVASIRAPQGR
jgi:small conductance mechanosensitive channel